MPKIPETKRTTPITTFVRKIMLKIPLEGIALHGVTNRLADEIKRKGLELQETEEEVLYHEIHPIINPHNPLDKIVLRETTDEDLTKRLMGTAISAAGTHYSEEPKTLLDNHTIEEDLPAIIILKGLQGEENSFNHATNAEMPYIKNRRRSYRNFGRGIISSYSKERILGIVRLTKKEQMKVIRDNNSKDPEIVKAALAVKLMRRLPRIIISHYQTITN